MPPRPRLPRTIPWPAIRRGWRPVVLPLLLLAVGGCRPPTPESHAYLPLTPTARWDYGLTTTDLNPTQALMAAFLGKLELTLFVDGEEKVGGTTLSRLGVQTQGGMRTLAGQLPASGSVRVAKDQRGVVLVYREEGGATHDAVLVPEPPRAGRDWVAFDDGRNQVSGHVDGTESLVAGPTTYRDCLKVSYREKTHPAQMVTAYFHRDAGLVRVAVPLPEDRRHGGGGNGAGPRPAVQAELLRVTGLGK